MGKHHTEDYKLSAVKYSLRTDNQVETCEVFDCKRSSLQDWLKLYNDIFHTYLEKVLYKHIVVMEFWEKTQYKKWYLSHRRFSFTSRHLIELYEEDNHIPDSIFKPFLKSLDCHSKGEEKRIFNTISVPETLFDEHSHIILTKIYTNEEKYNLCKSLLIHMKDEEAFLKSYIEKAQVPV